MEMLQRHSWLGALIASAIPGMEGVIGAVNAHHERWDGTGYSGQLKGEEIPLLGRITAVADAFSAMTTDRSYRRALTWEDALQEVRANRGTQFDPEVVDAFLKAAQAHGKTKSQEQEQSSDLKAA